MNLTISDIKWAAEECERQRSGELSVAWMCYALGWMRDYDRSGVTDHDMQGIVGMLGSQVEPIVNRDGFRRVEVRVGWVNMPPASQVHRLVNNLCDEGSYLTPAEWFREFEEIHPFRDGNGRTGAILFNWMNGTLDDPVTAPDFWNPSHPNYQT